MERTDTEQVVQKLESSVRAKPRLLPPSGYQRSMLAAHRNIRHTAHRGTYDTRSYGGDICPQAQGRAIPRDSIRNVPLAEERRPVNLQPRQLASSICEHGTTADLWPTGAG